MVNGARVVPWLTLPNGGGRVFSRRPSSSSQVGDCSLLLSRQETGSVGRSHHYTAARCGGESVRASFQPGDGWDFEAHESELQSDRAPNFPWEQQLGPTKLELSLSPSKSPSVLSDQPFTEQVHKLKAQVSRMEREFAARTTEAEALKQSLAGTFNAMAEQMKLINAELKRVKSDLRHAESVASPSRFVGLGSTQAVYMDSIMDRVRQELKSYATQAELQNLQQLSLPADLVGQVSTIEGELFNNAGSVPQLGE